MEKLGTWNVELITPYIFGLKGHFRGKVNPSIKALYNQPMRRLFFKLSLIWQISTVRLKNSTWQLIFSSSAFSTVRMYYWRLWIGNESNCFCYNLKLTFPRLIVEFKYNCALKIKVLLEFVEEIDEDKFETNLNLHSGSNLWRKFLHWSRKFNIYL